jgi:hypothetical protein
MKYWTVIACAAWISLTAPAFGQVQLVHRAHDPYGVPRPAPNQEHVPPHTSFYVELNPAGKEHGDIVLEESVGIDLESAGDRPVPLLKPGRQFALGYSGRFIAGRGAETGPTVGIYVENGPPLHPATRYTVHVRAGSRRAPQPVEVGTWQFTTAAAPTVHAVDFALKDGPVVTWHGGFFTGYCSVSFCTGRVFRLPTFDLMDRGRRAAPRAWTLQRDFWLTGTEHRPGILTVNLPNIVRERETRRIVAIENDPRGTLLRVEDFYGHQQYGIADNRPLGPDYHAGDEVLVADGLHDARARVLAVDDARRTVLLSKVSAPADGWKLAYAATLRTKEDPNAPGLFPSGGCYLRKFAPVGTPVYYWGRVDCEWDLAVQRYGRRVLPNFADAPGDLSRDGRDWTTAKDYAELHSVAQAIAGHLIDRYGERALAFPWSIFNEPDLGPLFWRADWDELQRYYDYAVDGVLRAFEDRGYDSGRVFIGGLELAGIFGTHLRLREFLTHCAPNARPVKGALLPNAAFADRRLDGKRSRRVEDLCRAHDGRGSPCEFVSIHAYNTSKLMADKLAAAKQMALEVDPEYYARLWVDSHESCPGWDLPPDPAYGDSYLGNGYFPTWCADVARRQLRRAADDPRYAFGESILTVWPWPNPDFGGGNDCVRELHIQEGGTVTVPMPNFHFLTLLAQMGPTYRVLPETTVAGHVASGFVSNSGGTTRALVYTHDPLDTESRSEDEFNVTLALTGLPPGPLLVREYRFDGDHNSYFHLARRLRDEPEPLSTPDQQRLDQAVRALESPQRAQRLFALRELVALGRRAAPAAAAIVRLLIKCEDPEERERLSAIFKAIVTPRAYPTAVVRKIEEQAQLRPSAAACKTASVNGALLVKLRVAGNGANYVVLEPLAHTLPW